MTSEEAIKHGKEQSEIFWGKNRKFAKIAVRSLEAWDKVIDHLDSRIAETVKDIEEDPDNEEWYLGFWECLHELKGVIGNLVKEVEK